MYLIGSAALHEFTNCDFKDYDLVLEGENIQPEQGIDIAPQELFDEELYTKYDSGIVAETPVGPAKVIDPIGLMLIKRSHLFRPISFQKHIRSYHALYAEYGKYIDTDYRRLLKNRISLTKQKFGDRTPSLKKSKEDFFDDYVKKVYDHDEIHLATCYYDRPIYERMKPDADLVWCSKDLWEQLPHKDKIRCVREEGYAIAIERFLLWKRGYPEKFAFSAAVEKICTTLTGSWFRDFSIDNWPEIIQYDQPFLKMFLDKGYKLCC